MLSKNSLKWLISTLILTCSIRFYAEQDERYAIVFDVGGVLIEESQKSVGWTLATETGIFGALGNIAALQKTKQVYHAVLDAIGQHIEIPIPTYNKDERLSHAYSVRMTGIMSPEEIRQEASDVIRLWRNEDTCSCPYHKKRKKHFASAYHAQFVENSIQLTFDPARFMKYFSQIRAGNDLLHRCAIEKNRFGAPRHELFILSNFDTEMWDELIKNRQLSNEICAHIPQECDTCGDNAAASSHCLISGMFHSEQHIKPNPVIYHLLLHRCAQHGIVPNHVIFIDDTLQNVVAARELGICAYHVSSEKSFKAITDDLEAKGILQR